MRGSIVCAIACSFFLNSLALAKPPDPEDSPLRSTSRISNRPASAATDTSLHRDSQFRAAFEKAIERGCDFGPFKRAVRRQIPSRIQTDVLNFIAWQAAHVTNDHAEDFFFYLGTFCQGSLSGHEMGFISMALKDNARFLATVGPVSLTLIHPDMSGFYKAWILKKLVDVHRTGQNLNEFRTRFNSFAPADIQTQGSFGMREGKSYNYRGIHWFDMMNHLYMAGLSRQDKFIAATKRYFKTGMHGSDMKKISGAFANATKNGNTIDHLEDQLDRLTLTQVPSSTQADIIHYLGTIESDTIPSFIETFNLLSPYVKYTSQWTNLLDALKLTCRDTREDLCILLRGCNFTPPQLRELSEFIFASRKETPQTLNSCIVKASSLYDSGEKAYSLYRELFLI